MKLSRTARVIPALIRCTAMLFAFVGHPDLAPGERLLASLLILVLAELMTIRSHLEAALKEERA